MSQPLTELEPNEIKRIQTLLGLNQLYFCSSPEWGSQNKNYRSLIRQELKKVMTSLSPSEMQLDQIEDLNILPTTTSASISISHCPQLGGFAISERQQHIGIDIEVRARIGSSHIQRISTEEEIQAAPELSFLWGAKEAGFKALSDNVLAPKVLRQLHIVNWNRYHENLFGFSVRLSNFDQISPGRGALTVKNNLIFSFFMFSP